MKALPALFFVKRRKIVILWQNKAFCGGVDPKKFHPHNIPPQADAELFMWQRVICTSTVHFSYNLQRQAAEKAVRFKATGFYA